MTTTQATAEVFWTAFTALNKAERGAFLERLIGDPRLREDLLDAALIEERKEEPARGLEEVLVDLRRPRARR